MTFSSFQKIKVFAAHGEGSQCWFRDHLEEAGGWVPRTEEKRKPARKPDPGLHPGGPEWCWSGPLLSQGSFRGGLITWGPRSRFALQSVEPLSVYKTTSEPYRQHSQRAQADVAAWADLIEGGGELSLPTTPPTHPTDTLSPGPSHLLGDLGSWHFPVQPDFSFLEPKRRKETEREPELSQKWDVGGEGKQTQWLQSPWRAHEGTLLALTSCPSPACAPETLGLLRAGCALSQGPEPTARTWWCPLTGSSA